MPQPQFKQTIQSRPLRICSRGSNTSSVSWSTLLWFRCWPLCFDSNQSKLFGHCPRVVIIVFKTDTHTRTSMKHQNYSSPSDAHFQPINGREYCTQCEPLIGHNYASEIRSDFQLTTHQRSQYLARGLAWRRRFPRLPLSSLCRAMSPARQARQHHQCQNNISWHNGTTYSLRAVTAATPPQNVAQSARAHVCGRAQRVINSINVPGHYTTSRRSRCASE